MSVGTDRPPLGARRAGTHSVGLAFVTHLIGAALFWSIVSRDVTVVYNEDFARWAWFAGILGVAVAGGIGGWRRSWNATMLGSLGVGAAVSLELVAFVSWIVGHSQ